MIGVLESSGAEPSGEDSTLVKKESETVKRLKVILRPAFKKYDANENLTLDVEELALLLRDLGEMLSPSQGRNVCMYACIYVRRAHIKPPKKPATVCC